MHGPGKGREEVGHRVAVCQLVAAERRRLEVARLHLRGTARREAVQLPGRGREGGG